MHVGSYTIFFSLLFFLSLLALLSKSPGKDDDLKILSKYFLLSSIVFQIFTFLISVRVDRYIDRNELK